jgi:heat shock protein HtpX
MNQFKTVLLLGLLTGLLVALGGAMGGRGGMIIALVIAAAMNFFSYWYSDKIVLKMYRARPVTESEASGVYGMVRELAQNAGLPTPRVYVVDDDTPNAFATGRNPENAVVAVTTGILGSLSPGNCAAYWATS